MTAAIETLRQGFLHRLGRELREKDAMTLFDGHSVTRKLVIRREPRWMGRLGNFPYIGDFLQCVDSISLFIDRVHEVHAGRC